jgi:hypothetical protein
MLRTGVDARTVGAHTPSMRRGYVALVLGGVVLALAACTSTSAKSCGNRKCPAPAGPHFEVRMAIDGKRVPLSSHRTPIKIGRPVRIDVYIDRPSGVDVTNVYLFVNSYPFTFGATPSSRVKILTHHVDSVPQGQPVTGQWTPEPLFDTRQLDVSVDFEMAGASIGPAVGHLQLVP